MMIKRTFAILLAAIITVGAFAQEEKEKKEKKGIAIHGSFQTDILTLPQVDNAIGATAESYSSPFMSNNYLDLALSSEYVNATSRLELRHSPLPGFESDFAGGGLQNISITGHYKWFEMTIGDIYDQFGSGLIFRTYEERTLGIDNSLRGARLNLSPYRGIRFKALGGMQRQYYNYAVDNALGFDYSKGAVMGLDLELDIDEWIPKMAENDYHLLIGGSYVSKYEPDELIQPTLTTALNLPNFVGAGDVRVRLQKGGWNALVEYAYKANDPIAAQGKFFIKDKETGEMNPVDFKNIYHNGSALLLSLSYSQKGMSFMLQAKRSENMAFRSKRSVSGSSAFINHLPAFSMTHTYALAALHPYATQTLGEWAFQAEARYTFPRKTKMGGKYGTSFRLNATYIRGLKMEPVEQVNGSYMGTDGYKSPFFGMGDETYYVDAHLEFSKKITKTFSMVAMYMYQQYNQRVVEGEGKHGDIVHSNIGIVELKYKPSSNIGMRGELQYLYSKQDMGQWIFALYEISLYQQAVIEISDLYNIGGTPEANHQHYYKIAAAYNWKSHRVQLAWGRTRAGYNCSGGVCRFVPASTGLSLSYLVNF